jgi:Tfp pilus assembly PilM family ATPase
VKFKIPSLSSKSIVGLDVGSSTVKAVELTMKGRCLPELGCDH